MSHNGLLFKFYSVFLRLITFFKDKKNLGDSLAYHHNMKFSTKDNDQDNASSFNCAQYHTGAFWYNKCYSVKINGQYLGGRNDQPGKGLIWWKFRLKSLKTSQMKFRPDYI